MRILSLVVAGFLISSSSFGYFYELRCDANFQTEVGKDPETVTMVSVSPGKFGDEKYVADLRNFTYEVIVHRSLDTFYMTIRNGQTKVLFSTARVPSFEHNDSMTDMTFSDGTRRWISCAYAPTKQSSPQ